MLMNVWVTQHGPSENLCRDEPGNRIAGRSQCNTPNNVFGCLRLRLSYNVMLHQTLFCFCLNEAKRPCLNDCSWLLDDLG